VVTGFLSSPARKRGSGALSSLAGIAAKVAAASRNDRVCGRNDRRAEGFSAAKGSQHNNEEHTMKRILALTTAALMSTGIAATAIAQDAEFEVETGVEAGGKRAAGHRHGHHDGRHGAAGTQGAAGTMGAAGAGANVGAVVSSINTGQFGTPMWKAPPRSLRST
jgi:hypothetical protein